MALWFKQTFFQWRFAAFGLGHWSQVKQSGELSNLPYVLSNWSDKLMVRLFLKAFSRLGPSGCTLLSSYVLGADFEASVRAVSISRTLLAQLARDGYALVSVIDMNRNRSLQVSKALFKMRERYHSA